MVAVLAEIPVRRQPAPVVLEVLDPAYPRPDLRVVPPAVSRPRPAQAVFWRRRLVALGILVAVVLCGVIGVRATAARTGGDPLAATGAPAATGAAERVWVVRPGDTLWTIASAIDPKGDVRPLVDKLAAEVGNASLFPGERVPIPSD